MWTYKGEIIKTTDQMLSKTERFVYLITNTINGKMYIGKKLLKFKRSRSPLKGKQNRRRYKVDSDWQDYYVQ